MKLGCELLLLLFLLCTAFTLNCFADPVLTTNGGFETGDFTGWSTAGDTLVVNSSFGVTSPGGSFQALISNAPGLCCGPGTDVPNPGYPFIRIGTLQSYSGTPSLYAASGGPASPSPLET